MSIMARRIYHYINIIQIGWLVPEPSSLVLRTSLHGHIVNPEKSLGCAKSRRSKQVSAEGSTAGPEGTRCGEAAKKYTFVLTVASRLRGFAASRLRHGGTQVRVLLSTPKVEQLGSKTRATSLKHKPIER